MRKRLLECIGVLAAIIAVTVLLELAPVPVAGQAQRDPGQGGGHSGSPDGVGRAGPAGYLDHRLPDSLTAPRSVCRPRVFHRRGTSRTRP